MSYLTKTLFTIININIISKSIETQNLVIAQSTSLYSRSTRQTVKVTSTASLKN